MVAKTEFNQPSPTDISFVRRFMGSRERLWAMWTQAEHLQRWWGPQRWTTPICQVDFRPDGVWFYCLQDPEGNRYCGKMIYGEIDAPRRFTGTDVFTDEDGETNENMPAAQSAYEFAEDGEETIVTNFTRYASAEARDKVMEMGVEAGINQTLDRLDAYLASLRS